MSFSGIIFKILTQIALCPCLLYRLNCLLADYQLAVLNFLFYFFHIFLGKFLSHVCTSP